MKNEELHDLIKEKTGGITVKDILTITVSTLIALGGLVTAWVNLNSNQVRLETRVTMNEKYMGERVTELKSYDSQLRIIIEQSLKEQTKSNKELQEQVNELEGTLSQLYRQMSSRKR